MNAPELQAQNDPHTGVYERATGLADEWWRVSLSDRPHMYRIEHGGAGGRVDIDTVVDLDNLRAKLIKWQREGFGRAGDEQSETEAPRDSGFLAALKHAIETTSKSAKPRAARIVTVGNVRVPVGRASPLVPAVNPAYLFAERFNDIIADIVENRRVMLIGHTGAGKTSLIEQLQPARSTASCART
jgi:cobaltochelatase CobS